MSYDELCLIEDIKETLQNNSYNNSKIQIACIEAYFHVYETQKAKNKKQKGETNE